MKINLALIVNFEDGTNEIVTTTKDVHLYDLDKPLAKAEIIQERQTAIEILKEEGEE